jgi:ATP-dependent helicase/nuclease subunit B
MLEFLKVKNPNQIKLLLKTYDPLKDTWIVSDLKSKQEIQNESLIKYGYYTDDAILRVSDFWRIWVRRLEPTLNVVSSDFIKSLVHNFVEAHGTALEIIDSEVSTLNKAVQEFAPILLHPASDDVLEEWLESQSEPKKWTRWYQLAKVCLRYILHKEKTIDTKWAAAYLQSLDLNLLTWDHKIYIDLGSELTTVEMGLFKHISQKQDVVVITPEPFWKNKFPYLLNTYRENFGFGKLSEAQTESSDYHLTQSQFVRLSTQLAEIKFAVSNLRKWADSGIALDKIAIICADIEKYWPVLQFYLEEEGITYKKDVVAQLNSLGDIQNLLAAIKNLSSEVAWDSLEKSFFNKGTGTEIRYEKFKALFYQLYDQDDLARDQKIKNLFYKKIDFSSDMSRDDFLKFLVTTWITLPQSNNKNEIFETVFKDFLAQSLNIKIKFKLWVQFLKNRLSHKEINIKRSTSYGVHIVPLMSAQMIDVSHRIYIGLNDEYYHKKQKALMSLNDSMALRTQFDLAVDYSEESYLDFNLRWQALSCNENTILTSSHLSFTSEPINSSLFFIENSPQSETTSPKDTRIDELQKQFSHEDEINDFKGSVEVARLLEDVKGYEAQVKSEVFRQLSVSDIENYAQCSFKLLAAKGFRLRDLPQVSLDLDPRQKGSLVHALFECIINLMSQGEYKLEAIAEFLETKRCEFDIYPQQDAYWNIQKSKFLVLAQKFYEFEKQRINIFSVKTEQAVQMYFDLNKNEFTLAQPEKFFSFNIRIDRVDTHKNHKYSVVYDYKSSGYQVENYAKWLTEYHYQMLLYMIALQLVFKEESQIKAALYYQYKTFDIKKGLIDEVIAVNEFGLTKRNKSLISVDKVAELENKFALSIADVLQNLDSYKFNTRPVDMDICTKCDWRKLCRAPHLM